MADKVIVNELPGILVMNPKFPIVPDSPRSTVGKSAEKLLIAVVFSGQPLNPVIVKVIGVVVAPAPVAKKK
jgi:hypothetical protein